MFVHEIKIVHVGGIQGFPTHKIELRSNSHSSYTTKNATTYLQSLLPIIVSQTKKLPGETIGRLVKMRAVSGS